MAKPVIGNHQLNMTRFICSVLLHLQILPEIKISVEMMRYTVMQDPKAFDVVFPFLISFMKFTGGILTEIINGYKMSTATSIEDVVKDFVAFEIISQVDNFVVQTMTIDVASLIDSVKPPTYKDFNSEKKEGNKRDESQYFFFFAYKLFSHFYKILYFYYFPLLILGFVYLVGEAL